MLKNLIILFISMFGLIGCGGGSSSSSEQASTKQSSSKQVSFVDGKVIGIDYRVLKNGSVIQEGTIGDEGYFSYDTNGDELIFSLGNKDICSVTSVPSDNIITIQECFGLQRDNIASLLSDSSVDKTSETYLNVSSMYSTASFLIALDEDSSTHDIEISSGKKEQLEEIFTNNPNTTFEESMEDLNLSAPSFEKVQEHLKFSQKKFKLVADNQAPEIVSFSVSEENIITLIISEFISEDMASMFSLEDYNGTIKTVASFEYVTIDGEHRTQVIITPNSALSYSTEYSIIVSKNLTDYAGNLLLNGEFKEVFSSVDAPDTQAPTLSSTNKSFITTVGTALSLETVTASDNVDTSVAVTQSGTVDFNTTGTYTVTYSAIDSSGNSSLITHIYSVTEISDNQAQVVSSVSVTVDENQTFALTVTATGQSIVAYSLSGTDASSFDINPSTGVITFKTAPDYETKSSYSITVIASDTSSNTQTQNITININDVVEAGNISHNGFTYGIITSPITGKQWLDRNLGATEVCTKSRDSGSFANDAEYVSSQEACFGDYYQWSETDGSSICPTGFSVPTSDELYSETIQYSGTNDETTGAVKVVNRDSAFKNFLKFPASGYHNNDNDTLHGQGDYGVVWSSSVIGDRSKYLNFYDSNASEDRLNGAYSFSVRCIKD